MDQQELTSALALLAGRKWLPLIVLLIGWATRLLSDKSRFPVSVPTRWQPVIVLALSTLYATGTAVVSGASWRDAAVHAFVVACVTMGAFDLLVKAVFDGKEPTWLGWIALVFPKPAGTGTPPTDDKKDLQAPPS